MISFEDEQAIRAYFLPRALEEERRIQKTRKKFGWVLGVGIIYVIIFHLINYFFFEPTLLFVFPGTLLVAIAVMGFVVNSKNSVMELTPLERELL